MSVKVRAGNRAQSGQAGEAVPRQESLERLRRGRRWPLRRRESKPRTKSPNSQLNVILHWFEELKQAQPK
jgi:hypothetical protein